MEQCERCHDLGWRRLSRVRLRVYCQCPKGRELLMRANAERAQKIEFATREHNGTKSSNQSANT